MNIVNTRSDSVLCLHAIDGLTIAFKHERLSPLSVDINVHFHILEAKIIYFYCKRQYFSAVNVQNSFPPIQRRFGQCQFIYNRTNVLIFVPPDHNISVVVTACLKVFQFKRTFNCNLRVHDRLAVLIDAGTKMSTLARI